MAALPEGVVWCASPADHSAREEETDDGNDHHAEGRSADVGNWIEGNLSAKRGGGVSANFRDERVRCLVACSGEKENHIGDETCHEHCWGEVRHRPVRLGFRREESKPRRGRGGTRRAADAVGHKNEGNLKGLFIIALWAFSLYPNSGLRDRAGPRKQALSKNTISGENQWTSFYPRPVCGILSALRVLAAYLIRA
jgi:hypothetical protein